MHFWTSYICSLAISEFFHIFISTHGFLLSLHFYIYVFLHFYFGSLVLDTKIDDAKK